MAKFITIGERLSTTAPSVNKAADLKESKTAA